MNRSNPFRFDLRNGIRFIAKKFLVLPLLVSLVCFEFMLRLRETASLNHQYAGAQPTLGDFAMYLFGGMKPYIPNPDEPFLFPVSWFLSLEFACFLRFIILCMIEIHLGKWSSYIPAAAQSGGRPNAPGLSLQPSFTFSCAGSSSSSTACCTAVNLPFLFPLI